MVNYICVAENEKENNLIDLPLENDDTLYVTTLAAQYPSATGLKYNVNGRTRAVRCVDSLLYPPENGWGDQVYYCVYGKAEKRKADDDNGEAKKFKNTEDSPAFSADLVVLGLPWKTTDDDLKDYFQQYGNLELAEVKKDRLSGRSKGFGFIRFNDPEVQVRVMLKRHKFGDRLCDIRIPNSNKPYSASKVNVRKIFIGQVSEDITEDDLREYFGKYGEITDSFIPKPHRGFGFVTFSESDVVPQLTNREHKIRDSKIYVTEAIPKSETSDRYGSDRGYSKRGSGGYSGDYGFGGRSSSRYDSYGSRGGNSRSYDSKWGSSRRNDWAEDSWNDSNNSYGGGNSVWRASAPAKTDSNVDPNFIANVVNQAVAGVLSNIKGAPSPDVGGYGQDSRNGSDRRWNKWDA